MQTNDKENSINDPLIATEESLDTQFNRHDNSSNTHSLCQSFSQSSQSMTKYFPTIVHSMVTEADDSIIGWTNNGETFTVHDQSKLGPVLQKYFQHNKYPSFQRQLNMYGWKKFGCGKYKGSFYHPYFCQDYASSDFTKIKRKGPPNESIRKKRRLSFKTYSDSSYTTQHPPSSSIVVAPQCPVHSFHHHQHNTHGPPSHFHYPNTERGPSSITNATNNNILKPPHHHMTSQTHIPTQYHHHNHQQQQTKENLLLSEKKEDIHHLQQHYRQQENLHPYHHCNYPHHSHNHHHNDSSTQNTQLNFLNSFATSNTIHATPSSSSSGHEGGIQIKMKIQKDSTIKISTECLVSGQEQSPPSPPLSLIITPPNSSSGGVKNNRFKILAATANFVRDIEIQTNKNVKDGNNYD